LPQHATRFIQEVHGGIPISSLSSLQHLTGNSERKLFDIKHHKVNETELHQAGIAWQDGKAFTEKELQDLNRHYDDTRHEGENDPVIAGAVEILFDFAPPADEEERKEAIEKQIKLAIEKLALDTTKEKVLRRIVERYDEIFRTVFGHDEPTAFDPLEVRLKPDSAPKRCRNRSYSPEMLEKIKEMLSTLLDKKLIYKNNTSRWAAPIMLVGKPGRPGEYRLCVDLRWINSCTIPIQNPMPILDDVLQRARGCKYFFKGDFLQGYWQILLHEAHQEYFSFMTPFGVYTPTRLPQGSIDAPLYFQGCLQKAFEELIQEGCLVLWIDDIIGFAKTWEDYVNLLDRVFAVCRKYRLKLHAKKTDIGDIEAIYCGRVINGTGIKMNPRNYQTFMDMATPLYAGDLSAFVQGLTWMNNSLPRLNEHMAPLRELLDKVHNLVGSMKRSKYEKINLQTHSLWTPTHQQAYDQCKTILSDPLVLAHPLEDPNSTICLCTDASHFFYAGMLTQVVDWDESKPVQEQNHRPIAILSGQFNKVQVNWSTIEKEAFPIIDALEKWQYLCVRPKGIRVYTDHANLVHLYHPETVKPALSVSAIQKIHRWLLIISYYKITHMEHLPGPLNVWCDILSRWTNSNYYTLTSKETKQPLTPEVKSLIDRNTLQAQMNRYLTMQSIKAEIKAKTRFT